MGKMGITFHKIQIEHTFGFTDCFFVFMRNPGPDSSKNEQVIHKLFSKCGKLSFTLSTDVENSGFFVNSDKEPQNHGMPQKNEVDFIIKYIYNRPCVFRMCRRFLYVWQMKNIRR